eukprot:SAG31_NODE_2608_length_5388_cov_5.001702_3_plen_55_part_00
MQQIYLYQQIHDIINSTNAISQSSDIFFGDLERDFGELNGSDAHVCVSNPGLAC